MRITLNGGKIIALVRGVITREATDAIVNAANNERLLFGRDAVEELEPGP